MKLVVLSLAVVAAGACATATTLPPDRVATSEAAIRSAGELGADSVPQASMHLRLAEEELNRAKAFADEGRAERADLFLQRSSADAELALALVKEARATSDAERAQREADALEGSTR